MIDPNFPKTLPEFNARFTNEEDCRTFLQNAKWPQGYVCRKCSGTRYYYIQKRKSCECASCGDQESLIAGTVFENSKRPLLLWFFAIFHVTNTQSGLSAKALQRLMGFGSYQTAWTWLHKIRLAMKKGRKRKLDGEVEVDETFWGSAHPGKRGRGASGKTLIGCAVEKSGKGIGRIRFSTLEDASESSLDRFLQDCLKKKTTVNSDDWRGYTDLKAKGFEHVVQPDPDEDLPKVHLVASLLKRWILGTHHGGIQAKHFESYLTEFAFRFNRRRAKSVCHNFQRVMEKVVTGKPRPYWKIVGRKAANMPLLMAA